MENNKYKNGKIYRITDVGYNKFYVGSTVSSLSTRIGKHRAEYKDLLKGGKRSCSSFILFNDFGVDNCKIELIEYYPCDNVMELRKREGYHIENTVCVNKNMPGRSKSESDKVYRDLNRDLINKKKQIYMHEHKDHKAEYDKT